MADIIAPTGETLVDESAPTHTYATASPAYRRYVLWLLLLVYVINFLDRQVINILAEPIKDELHLADWQLGLLSGFAFGIVYTILGFPLARAADRHNRSVIISACLAGWSLFTGLSGLAQNFVQLVAARAGVGIGEAGCTPTSHALIADYTPREKRASALAFYAMGTPLGSLLGLAIGGALSDLFGWRRAFMVAAAPGLVLALVCLVTLKEPRQRIAQVVQATTAKAADGLATFSETFRYLCTKRAFWWLAFGAGIRSFLGYGHAPFVPSFFYRVHGPEVAQLAAHFGMKKGAFIGLALGVMTGVGGAIGSWTGGQIADRWGAKDLRIFASLPALAVLVSFPFTVTLYTTDSTVLALGLYFFPAFLGTLWYGPIYASAQGMVPQRMRAMSASIMLFIINFLGLVCGALAVGAISDICNKVLGLGPAEGVRWALIASTTGGLISALLFWLARKDVRGEMVS
jgi:MFS family permease